MGMIVSDLKCLRFVCACAAAVFCLPWVSSDISGQNLGAAHVVGHIDGIRLEEDQFHILGWACGQGDRSSINVHLYADRPATETPKGIFVKAATANLSNEPAIAQACQDHEGGKHRFDISLSNQELTNYQERKLYVHTIRASDGREDALITGSGTIEFPSPVLSGAYTGSGQHPRVFTTQADLNDLVKRINSPGSFSTQKFAKLASQVKNDLAAKVDWDATYSGCDLDIYLHAMSIEETRGYGSEVRSQDQMRSGLKVSPNFSAPAGAAPVASRLSLYAALVKAGAAVPTAAPTATDAAALGKRILLAWANHGLRDAKGNFINSATQFCDGEGHFDRNVQSGVGLQFGRAVVHSVHAQDLLQSLGELNATEIGQLNAFHVAMFDLIRDGANFRFGLPFKPCELYSNHVAGTLTGLLAIARLLDDKGKFNAVLYGVDHSIPVLLPWTKYFNHAIYGESDQPIECYANTGPDSLSSHPAFQTSVVAPGEIEDRYRNANPLQGIGYPMGTLEHLFSAAEIMRNAGIDAYGYRGAHKQSIEMATRYYACFSKYAGFYKTVTSDNSRACPNYQQYVGKTVNDVEHNLLIGADRFGGDAAITEQEQSAEQTFASSESRPDAVFMGHWRH
jgi:hypothetical protein